MFELDLRELSSQLPFSVPNGFVLSALSTSLQFATGFAANSWVHGNGGIIDGGVACVCAKRRAVAHFSAFLRFFVRFCAFFPTIMVCKKSANLRRILQKCAKSAFVQYPL